MNKIQKLVVIAFAFVLSLSLMSFKKSSSSDVNTFADKLRNAKNLEYEVTVYNKNSASNKYMKKFSSDTTIRQGQIQFNPQVFSEYVLSGYGTTNDDGRVAKAKRIFASADDLNSYARIYSPEPNKGYKGFTSPKENGWVWIDKDEVVAPEVGRSEDILKLYEKYASKFKKTEDDNYIYLDYSGDASKDFEQVGKAQQTFADNKVFKSGKQYVKSVKLRIHLVIAKKDKATGEKMVPSEARIQIKAKGETDGSGAKLANEDNFIVSYRDINKINSIEKPAGI